MDIGSLRDKCVLFFTGDERVFFGIGLMRLEMMFVLFEILCTYYDGIGSMYQGGDITTIQDFSIKISTLAIILPIMSSNQGLISSMSYQYWEMKYYKITNRFFR